MKKSKFSHFIAILIGFGVILSSCEENGNGGEKSVKNLSGEYSDDITVEGTDVTLTGKVVIKGGATITIKPGTVITADASDLSYLLIEQGAKIEAVGTEAEPIIFTANSAQAGAWGGLHICGKASINSGATGLSEIGDAPYGGAEDNDNSGILKYVRVEYSGTTLDPTHEANGISFYGVGSGTTVDYVEVYIGEDDGIEFFGGTVNIKHAVVYGCGDDSYDWTQGWRGKSQYLIAIQTAGGDRGFEGDNLGSDNTATPYASPVFSQVTLIGDNEGEGYGMKLREGTKGEIKNFIVSNFDKRSIHVEHNQTISNVNDGSLTVDYGKVNDQVSDKPIKYSVSKVQADYDVNGDGMINEDDEIDDPNAPTLDSSKKFEVSSNIEIADFSAITAETTYTGGIDMSSVDQFFSPDATIGAGSGWASAWAKSIN